ncbi:LamG-like jellyroll fold domain-containing protein [Bacteroides sp.]
MLFFMLLVCNANTFADTSWSSGWNNIEWVPSRGIIRFELRYYQSWGGQLAGHCGFVDDGHVTIKTMGYEFYVNGTDAKDGSGTAAKYNVNAKSNPGNASWDGAHYKSDAYYIYFEIPVSNAYRNKDVSLEISGTWWREAGATDQSANHTYNIKTTTPEISINSFEYIANKKIKVNTNGGDFGGYTLTNEKIYLSGNSRYDGAYNSSIAIEASDAVNSQKRAKVDVTFRPSNAKNASYSTYTTSFEKDAPTFAEPQNLKSSYNQEACQVTVSWDIPNVFSNARTDNFVVERTDLLNGNKSETFTVKFESSKTKYELLQTFEQGKDYKFRYEVYRTTMEGYAKPSIEIAFSTAHCSPDKIWAEEQGDKILVRWEDSGSIWSEGSTCKLVQYNVTTGSTYDIELFEADYRKHEYTDEMVKSCNEYIYRIQVVPGNTKYEREKMVQSVDPAVPYIPGTIHTPSGSKGYYQDRTELSWKSPNAFDRFIAERKPYGDSDTNYRQIGSVNWESGKKDYVYKDETGAVGTIYQYRIYGVITCGSTDRYSQDTLYTVGFRTRTGVVSGRVTYENGQAVQGVEIFPNSDDLDQGLSVQLKGNGYIRSDKEVDLGVNGFTLQAYVDPQSTTPKNQTIFNIDKVSVGFNADGALEFRVGDTRVKTEITDKDKFFHISAVYRKAQNDSIDLYINGIKKDSAQIGTVYSPAADALTIGATATLSNGKVALSNYFNGNVDEVRVWEKALDAATITADYTRMLYGGENGLLVYYRFNEGVEGEVYDLSFRGEFYHEHHATAVNMTYNSSEDALPTLEQLAIKGVTDLNGNYTVNGVPYSSRGTNYRIIPRYLKHQFDPTEKQIFMSESSSNFTCDFVDKSSFSVSGHIYYSESTIPVEGVSFEIDGATAMSKNKVVFSASDGSFQINVPIGEHEVRAVKVNHTFRNDGLLLTSEKTNFFYDEPKDGIEFRDETRIKLVGRVGGGPVQDAYPLGHSLSKNNLSDNVTVSIELAGSGSNLFNIYDDEQEITAPGKVTEKAVEEEHFRPRGWDEGKKPYTNQVRYTAKSIEITPSPVTGEFVAYIIPENYVVSSVNVEGYGNIIDRISLNTRDSLLVKNSINEYDVEKDEETKHYIDTVRYQVSAKFIKRTKPVLEVCQLRSPGGEELAYFGDTIYRYNRLNGKMDTIRVYDSSLQGTDAYLFGQPIMHQGGKYTIRTKVFESYPYYNEEGESVASKEDRVPVTDGIVHFSNDIKGSVVDTAAVEKTGMAEYTFACGEPAMSSSDGVKQMEVTVYINDKPIDSKQTVKAIVLGNVSGGNNFVTAGPNIITTVLRDPPGSNSYSYLESGTAFETTDTYVGGMELSQEMGSVIEAGVKLKILIGFMGSGTIADTEVKAESKFTGVFNETVDGQSGTTTRLEFTNRWQTSDDPAYVGADGDLYIGRSTNVITGKRNSMELTASEDFDAAIGNGQRLSGSKDGKYLLVKQEALGMDVSFSTVFAYPQVHIEQVLIPQLKAIMAQKLLVGISKEEAQAIANNKHEIVYVSDIADSEDDEFGTKGHYTCYYPESGADGPFVAANMDTISTIRQSIDNWEKAIYNNEMAKVSVKDKTEENISFQAGGNIERTMAYTGTDFNTTSFSITTGAHQEMGFGSAFNGTGITSYFDLTETMHHGGEFSSTEEASKTFGFVLAEEGSDYLTVDVHRVNNNQKFEEILKDAQDGKLNSEVDYDDLLDEDDLKGAQNEYIFITRGGATSCPYEGGYQTRYYKKGTQLDQPTAQIEVPVITVEEPTVSNVPSARKAVYKLHLGNNSETNDDCYYDLDLIDATNPNGAKFYIDGTPLGNGRTFLVPAGEEMIKTLEVEKGTEMDYEGLQLVLHSQCQYDPTGFQEVIADSVTINAYFVPSCSEINLVQPLNKWILNAETKNITSDDKYFVPIKLAGFDVNYENFHHVDIQYKASAQSDDKWTTLVRYYKNQDELTKDKVTCEKRLIEGAEINYNWVLDPVLDVDQSYDICAVSTCRLSDNEADDVQTISNISTGIKDTYRPRLFGSPQPANGILGVEDEIRLNFNEEIAAGYITASKVSAKGIRNGVKNNYSTSVSFDGKGEYAVTGLERNFTGRSFTIEANLKRNSYGKATVFCMGNINRYFEVGFDEEGHLVVEIDGTDVVKSEQPISFLKGEWEHLAVVYENGAEPMLTAYYNYVQVIGATKVSTYSGIGTYVMGRDISGQNYFHGELNEFRIWSSALSFGSLNKNKDITLSGSEANLLAYYPMNEGKGQKLEDLAGANNASMHATWHLANPGFAASFDGSSFLKQSTADAIINDDMDYTLEFWFKGDKTQKNTALVANGKGNAEDISGGKRLLFVGFDEKGKLITRNNNYTCTVDSSYLDNSWHHYALAVSRSIDKTSVFVDGALQNWFNSENFGGVSSDSLFVGACRWIYDDGKQGIGEWKMDNYFTGLIDEVRLWNTYRNETLINQQNNTRLEGNETGLMVYLPFEKYITNSGMTELVVSWENQVKENTGASTNVGGVKSEDAASIKEVAAESAIGVEVVANKDALIINPTSPNAWNDYEQRIVTFAVSGIQDVNGNEIASPIVWTAFIDRNNIKWSEENIAREGQVYNSIEFETEIINIGGNKQSFSIENIPSWMEVTPASGNIGPKSSQTVKFRVSESLNVGSYDEVLYLVNDNNVSRPLNLNIKINGETPDWSVNPVDYQYNMNVYGKLKINNIYSNDAEDMLAAFSNGECVGVTHNQYVKEYDMWYTLLTIYNDSVRTEDLEFRIWDASTGKIFKGEPAEEIEFVSDTVYGSSTAPILFEAKEMMIQNISLNTGWNWISFNVQSDDLKNLSTILRKNKWTDDDMVKSDVEEEFTSYLSEESKWVGPMAGRALNTRTMYLIKSTLPQTLSVTGTPIRDKEGRTLDIKQGWNYISYLPTSNLTVKEALAGYEAKEGDVIKGQSGFSMYSEHVGWLGNLSYMKSGNGYMLYRTAPDNGSLVYPDATVNGLKAVSRSATTRAQQELPVYNYTGNMSVVAVVEGNVQVEANDRILAYVDGELRGEASLHVHPETGEKLYFISVAGDNKTPITFALERDGKIISRTSSDFDYTSNVVKGEVNEPYRLNFMDASQSGVYPRIFDAELNIFMPMEKTSAVEISIIDMSGRIIRRYDGFDRTQDYLFTTLKDLGNLTPGAYLVNVIVDGNKNVYKVEKK